MTRTSAPLGGALPVAARRRLADGSTSARQLRVLARLLDGCSARECRAMQIAFSRGRPEQAAEHERRARRYEDLCDLADAHAWQPAIVYPTLSEVERVTLRHTFDRLLREREAERERERLAVMARRAEAERLGYGPAYFEAALEHEADRVRTAPVGDRNNTLSKAAWALGRFVCAGQLTEGDVLAALVPASSLPSRESHDCVRRTLTRRCRSAA
jgi:hypothetical protein